MWPSSPASTTELSFSDNGWFYPGSVTLCMGSVIVFNNTGSQPRALTFVGCPLRGFTLSPGQSYTFTIPAYVPQLSDSAPCAMCLSSPNNSSSSSHSSSSSSSSSSCILLRFDKNCLVGATVALLRTQNDDRIATLTYVPSFESYDYHALFNIVDAKGKGYITQRDLYLFNQNYFPTFNPPVLGQDRFKDFTLLPDVNLADDSSYLFFTLDKNDDNMVTYTEFTNFFNVTLFNINNDTYNGYTKYFNPRGSIQENTFGTSIMFWTFTNTTFHFISSQPSFSNANVYFAGQSTFSSPLNCQPDSQTNMFTTIQAITNTDNLIVGCAGSIRFITSLESASPQFEIINNTFSDSSEWSLYLVGPDTSYHTDTYFNSFFVLRALINGFPSPRIYMDFHGLCIPGHEYNNDTCGPCLPGSMQPLGLGLSCILCPLGSYAPQNGTIYCNTCDYGQYTYTLGETNCTFCPPGTYTDDQGSTSSSACIPCPNGTYNNATGPRSTCLPCPPGYICPLASTSPLLSLPSSVPVIVSYPVPAQPPPAPLTVSLLVVGICAAIGFALMLLVCCSARVGHLASRVNPFALIKPRNAATTAAVRGSHGTSRPQSMETTPLLDVARNEEDNRNDRAINSSSSSTTTTTMTTTTTTTSPGDSYANFSTFPVYTKNGGELVFNRSVTYMEVFCTILFVMLAGAFVSHMLAIYFSSSNDLPTIMPPLSLTQSPPSTPHISGAINELEGTMLFSALLMGYRGQCGNGTVYTNATILDQLYHININGSNLDSIASVSSSNSPDGCLVKWSLVPSVNNSIGGGLLFPPLDMWTVTFHDRRAFGQAWLLSVTMMGKQNTRQPNSLNLAITPPDTVHAFRGESATVVELGYQVTLYDPGQAYMTQYGRVISLQQYSLGSMVDMHQFNNTYSGTSIVIKLSRQDSVAYIKNGQLYTWIGLLVTSVSNIGGLFTGLSILLTVVVLGWDKFGRKAVDACTKKYRK
eukprot:TRINITY_DN4773_c1_g1_i5.p1 TRINITY_DN4773_c1_g1~~TRINITY_DN4773_c1_g1_i5.p1  ORF type:complete len:1056 (-),score=170.02 TRINITY_DN4773_c1_g1_i5:57-2993(-)